MMKNLYYSSTNLNSSLAIIEAQVSSYVALLSNPTTRPKLLTPEVHVYILLYIIYSYKYIRKREGLKTHLFVGRWNDIGTWIEVYINS